MRQPGDVVAERYHILQPVGQGAVGAVYLARDEREGRDVALKEMLTGASETRFQQESKTLQRLNHPSIPMVWDSFLFAESQFIAMEYIDGMNLKALVADFKQRTGAALPHDDVLAYALQVCAVLRYLHEQEEHPILHRDVKPSNLILRKTPNQLVLVDFGLVNNQGAAPTQGVGSLGYAPPEQLQGRPEPRSDIYALGATMYYLMSGRDPTPLSVCRPREACRFIRWELAALVERATAQDPSERFGSAREMEDALRTLCPQKTDEFPRVIPGEPTQRIVLEDVAPPPERPPELPSTGSTFCGNCGHHVSLQSKKCEECGTLLPQTAVGDSPTGESKSHLPIGRRSAPAEQPAGVLPAVQLPRPKAAAPQRDVNQTIAIAVIVLMTICASTWVFLLLKRTSQPVAMTPTQTTPVLPKEKKAAPKPAAAVDYPVRKQRAIDMVTRGDGDKAVPELQQLWRIHPDPQVGFYLFTAYRDMEDHPQKGNAYQWARRVVAMAPRTMMATGAREYMDRAEHPPAPKVVQGPSYPTAAPNLPEAAPASPQSAPQTAPEPATEAAPPPAAPPPQTPAAQPPAATSAPPSGQWTPAADPSAAVPYYNNTDLNKSDH